MQRLATAGDLLRVWGELPPSLSPQTDRPLAAAQQSPPLTGAEAATGAETAIGAETATGITAATEIEVRGQQLVLLKFLRESLRVNLIARSLRSLRGKMPLVTVKPRDLQAAQHPTAAPWAFTIG